MTFENNENGASRKTSQTEIEIAQPVDFGCWVFCWLQPTVEVGSPNRMVNSVYQEHARLTIRFSPWVAGACFGIAALLLMRARPSGDYLLWSIGLGLWWFALIVLEYRINSGALRFVALLSVTFGQIILHEHLVGRGQSLLLLQGGMITLGVGTLLMALFRRWLVRFARLETPAAQAQQ